MPQTSLTQLEILGDRCFVVLKHRADLSLSGSVGLILPGDPDPNSDNLVMAQLLGAGSGRVARNGDKVPPLGYPTPWGEGDAVVVAGRFAEEIIGVHTVRDYDIVARVGRSAVPEPNWGWTIIEREAPREQQEGAIVVTNDDVLHTTGMKSLEQSSKHKLLSLGIVAATAPELLERFEELEDGTPAAGAETLRYDGFCATEFAAGSRVLWKHRGARSLSYKGKEYFVCNTRDVVASVPFSAEVRIPYDDKPYARKEMRLLRKQRA